jgi:hypothetical protein
MIGAHRHISLEEVSHQLRDVKMPEFEVDEEIGFTVARREVARESVLGAMRETRFLVRREVDDFFNRSLMTRYDARVSSPAEIYNRCAAQPGHQERLEQMMDWFSNIFWS